MGARHVATLLYAHNSEHHSQSLVCTQEKATQRGPAQPGSTPAQHGIRTQSTSTLATSRQQQHRARNKLRQLVCVHVLCMYRLAAQQHQVCLNLVCHVANQNARRRLNVLLKDLIVAKSLVVEVPADGIDALTWVGRCRTLLVHDQHRNLPGAQGRQLRGSCHAQFAAAAQVGIGVQDGQQQVLVWQRGARRLRSAARWRRSRAAC
mmetsp:Transcript_16296/g.48558  ORF Transcript_16296/g.48558 Transcript_16296/m.48558 type:complete len:206 (+) Transcript_16296:183-800(+)